MIDVTKGIVLWLHLFSVVLLIGGVLYGRLLMKATADTLAPDAAERVNDAASQRFRGRVVFTIVVLLITGIYNYFSTGSHSLRYHVLLAIKLLLVLHIFAASLMAMRPKNPRRARQLAGAGLSGIVVILISVFLSQLA
jgi:uncharacterized membrane protein